MFDAANWEKASTRMIEPMSNAAILAEFKEIDKVWVLKDVDSGKYVIIPHPKYPDRVIIHFFPNSDQAENVLKEIQKVSPKLRNRNIVSEEVKLLEACRRIAVDKTPGNADSFVVHPYNEVWEFLDDRSGQSFTFALPIGGQNNRYFFRFLKSR